MTKRTLGVSLYPDHSDLNEDKKYLELASKYGFSRIFMSMLEVSEGKEKVAAKFSDLINFAKSLGFSTTLDIAPNILINWEFLMMICHSSMN
jgi:Uncharacterized conserved protein